MNLQLMINCALAQRSMKKKELAALLGVHPNYIYILQSKKSTTTATLEKIAKALDMSVSELVKFSEV